MIIKVKMLDKILKGFIIAAILSRTSLLLSPGNYGQNPDQDDYKGKRFTNASTLALAYITVRLQKGGGEGGQEMDLLFKSIIALLIGTTVFTLFDKVWTDKLKLGDNLGQFLLGGAVVSALAGGVLHFIRDDTKYNGKVDFKWVAIGCLIAIAIDIGLEHRDLINVEGHGFLISGIVLLLDIAIICLMGVNISNTTKIGEIDMKKWSVLTIGLVLVVNFFTLFWNAAKTDGSTEAEVGWGSILMSATILIPLVIATGLLFRSEDKYKTGITKQVFYPLSLFYLVAMSYSISSGYLNIMNYIHWVSIIAVFGFLMWSQKKDDSIDGLLRLIVVAGIFGYIFGSINTDKETTPILFTIGAMAVASLFIIKKDTGLLSEKKNIDSIDILIVGSLLFAIAGATKTKTLDGNENDTPTRRATSPDIRGRNFSIVLGIIGFAFVIMSEMKLDDQSIWGITKVSDIPKFLLYLFGPVAVLILIASQSVPDFDASWVGIPLLALIALGIAENKLISRDNLKKLPKYLGGLVVVVLVIALIMYDIGSVDIESLIEWPLSTFSFGFYESVVPVSDYNTPFGDNQGGVALTNLTNSELDSKVIDANRSLLDRITFSTVGYRPSGSLQSGNFSYSLSFWCKIVDPSTDMINQKDNFVYMLRNGSPKMDSPGVSYSSSSNQLRVGTLVSNGVVEQYDIDNIPTHKWNHIVIVSEHRNLDTYLNGELVKSYMLNGVKAKMPADQLQVFPDFNSGKYSNAEITLVRTFPSALNMSQIKSIYKQNYLDSTPKKKWLWWMTPFWNPIKKSN